MQSCIKFDILIWVSFMQQKGGFHIDRLATLRKERGWTQRKLSVKSGVHRVLIAKYETGAVTPTVRNLQRLAVALGVTIDELIDRRAG